MKYPLVIVFLVVWSTAFGQKKDSSAVQSRTEEVRIVADTTKSDDYFIITITKEKLKVRLRNRPLEISSIAQLADYLKKNIEKIDKERIAVEYPLNTPFQTVEPLFDLLKRNGIYKWRLMMMQ